MLFISSICIADIIICCYFILFQEQLQFKEGENAVMYKVFDLYLHFLQTSQSEAVQKHAFAALRAFINKVSRVGSASLRRTEAYLCCF